MKKKPKLYLGLFLSLIFLNIFYYLLFLYSKNISLYLYCISLGNLIGLISGIFFINKRLELESKKQWKKPSLKSRILWILGLMSLIIATFLSLNYFLFALLFIIIGIILLYYSKVFRYFKLNKGKKK
jgi:Ca2+/Na+ antiporter